jgi:uncharacterized membrane protein YczE
MTHSAAHSPSPKQKSVFYQELAYVIAILLLAFGASCMTTAGLGLSMVVAPAYLVHLKLSQFWPVITFGVAEYIVQALLLVGLCLVLRRFHLSFLGSFLTALFYGWALDRFLALWGDTGDGLTLAQSIPLFALGMILCALGVSFVLHTYLPPEVYELVVKEVSAKLHLDSGRVKTIYDCTSCVVAVVLSFLFYGLFQFRGVYWGTLVCALCTGTFVGWFNRLLEGRFTFQPACPKLAAWFSDLPQPENG